MAHGKIFVRDDGAPPQLGFGASGAWAHPVFADRDAARMIDAALSLGIRHFDTAGFYQNGRAETRLGCSLTEARRAQGLARSELVLSTKIGKTIDQKGGLVRDFSHDGIQAALDRSRDRLAVDTIDIVYLHGPDKHELSSCLPHLMEHRAAGTIGAIGVCSDAPHLASAAKHPDIDVVMGRYNVLDQTNRETFRVAKAEGKSTVAIAPLAQGLWQKRRWLPRSLPDMWYIARAAVRNRAEWQTARRTSWLHEIDGWSAAEIATAFVADCPDVDVMITTSTRAHHLEEVAAALGRPFPDAAKTRAYGLM